MSMLAEKKRKQKLSLNPRGKAWANDANNFGQKMLEKMGWQQGKGLGVKENGITQHIKISYKNDTQGIGYKCSDEQWTKHESNFSALLESLSGVTKNPKDIKVNSLEKKSQTSRARVHYHKFTRGKDLSRYSAKDLANIFGKRNLKDVIKSEQSEDDHQEERKSEVGETSLLFNGGSMKDYFKKKLSSCSNTNTYITTEKADSESEVELRPGFGLGFKPQISKYEDNLQSHKNKCSFISYINEESNKRKADFENDIVSPKKKVKKGFEKHGISNPAFNPVTTINLNKHILNTIEENCSEESSESCEKLSFIEFNSKNICIQNSTSMEKEIGSKKKEELNLKNNKKMKETTEGNEHLQINLLTKKKKQRKIENDILRSSNSMFISNEENILEHSKISVENNNFEISVKIKNRKTVPEVTCKGISNPVFDNNICAEFEENSPLENNKDVLLFKNPYDIKVRNRKKNVSENVKKKVTLNNIDTRFENDEIKASKKNKKSGKKYVEHLGVNNPIFEDIMNDTSESCEDLSNQNLNEFHFKKISNKKQQIGNYLLEDSSVSEGQIDEAYEIEENLNTVHTQKKKDKKNKRKKNNLVNSHLDLGSSNNLSCQNDSNDIDSCDLMLNVVCTPSLPKSVKTEHVESIEKSHNVKKKKSVRFSDVTQELIIPNNVELKILESEYGAGIDNINFDYIQAHVDANLETISKTLDMYHAEIENDINEKKQTTLDDVMVGEVGNPYSENEKLQGGTKLKFKYADFDTRTPVYQLNKAGAKKSYKHLIKGDIVVKFNNTNLHEIKGYATANRKHQIHNH